MAPRIHWLWLYVIINILAVVIMTGRGELIGDLAGNSVPGFKFLLGALLLVLLSYIAILGPLFNLLSRLKIKKMQFDCPESRVFDRIGLVILLLSSGFFLYNIITGANLAGNESITIGSPIRFVWILLPSDALFFIFYGYGRESRYFYPNLAVWLISNLLRGWVGMLIFVVFFEWCYNYRKRNITIVKALSATAGLMVLYPILTALKFYIRSSFRAKVDVRTIMEVVTNVSVDGGFFGAMWGGITEIVSRLQVVSNLVEVIRIKDLLQQLFRDGRILPFWLEGSIGDLYYKFIGNKPDSITLLFPKVHGYMGVSELEATNINIGFMGWYFISPEYFLLYLIFVIALTLVSFYFTKKIGITESSKDMLWLMWLMFLLPPWFAVIINYIYALIAFLALKIILSNQFCDRWFPDHLFDGKVIHKSARSGRKE